MKITYAEFIELIKARKGAIALGMESRTDSGARKTGNPFGTIFKRSRSSKMTGVSYEGAVNRRIEEESPDDGKPFKAEELWKGKGEYVEPNKIARHTITRKLYLATQGSNKQWEAFPARTTYETAEGKQLTYDEVAPFLPEKTISTKQAAHGLVVNQQNFRLYLLENITAIHLDGITYELVEA